MPEKASTKKSSAAAATTEGESTIGSDPLWYKDAVIYQLHVRSFLDSDNDGIGDFAGLTQKLDYLQDLGVTALWLLPFYPSPLRDDGYDIADYTTIHPAYGDLKDFKTFVREAHARGLRVITELVINHTSDQHPWFQRARRAKPGSADRDFYVWSDTPEKYQDARIIFKDFETSNWSWDPVAKAYYWHRFYSHQPDLNFDNPRVRRTLLDLLEYWLRLGVDGLRLDAVPYLYERQGTNCENLPETHAFLKQLRKRVDELYPDRMLLAEANQWPEDAIAYFGDGDECHTAFHFPVMPRLFMAIHMEDRFPIVDILQQTPPIPPDCQWLIFLRNHDELTLEMVTDEERDYMYRIYARDRQARINLGIRRRLAPLLGNNRRKIELMNALLCALPGTPVIYYGDEIGMGDNIYLGDRHGVRTPMQWSPDRNAGFSDVNPQRLYSPVIIEPEYLFETVNVETQQNNPHSLLWWMKRVIALRQHYVALRRGTIDILAPENSKILAFTRDHEQQSVLMVANLSRFSQYVELDLSKFAGRTPVEMFGQTRFPPIGKSPYVLTLSPHTFLWFALEAETSATSSGTVTSTELTELKVPLHVSLTRRGRLRKSFEAILVRALPERRWFAGPPRRVQAVHVTDAIPLMKNGAGGPRAMILRVDFLEGEAENYLLPLDTAWGSDAERLVDAIRPALLAALKRVETNEPGVLFDASADPAFAAAAWDVIRNRRKLKGSPGTLRGWSTSALAEIELSLFDLPAPIPLRTEGLASTMLFGDKLLLKIYKRIESGLHPEVEIGRFLAQRAGAFANAPPLYGAIDYSSGQDDAQTVALLEGYTPHTVNGWQFACDELSRFFETVLAQGAAQREAMTLPADGSLWELAAGGASETAKDLLGAALEWSALLGRRTAELHAALASDPTDPAFAPEPFGQLYQRSLYQAARKQTLQTLSQLKRRVKSLTDDAAAAAQAVLDQEKAVLEVSRAIVGQSLGGRRIRCHGDFTLSHVQYTGKDFLIVDFDGRPTQSLGARRIKRSAIEDLAAMIHSLRRAATQGSQPLPSSGPATPDALATLQLAASFWHAWISSAFLRAYLAASPPDLLPTKREQLDTLLRFYLMDEATNELEVELHDGGERLAMPLKRIVELLQT